MFVAMGHGRAGGEMELSDNIFINLSKDLVEKFDGDRCPNLCGKPKIFLFQACRGKGGFQWYTIYLADHYHFLLKTRS